MAPADTVIERTGETTSGPGAMSHEAYYALAAAAFPGAGLGGYALPEEVRFVVHRGAGARLQEVRGNWYIDYVCGAGALILGHAHPAVVAAVQEQAARGLHYLAP